MRILQGIRVVEVCNFISGPWTTQLLAEFGAEVIKVENPNNGDPFRSHTPDNYSPSFCAHNRHKKSVTLDLSKAEGKRLFIDLVAHSDVVVENFRPGVMDKLGIGWDTLSKANERLVYCAVSGFGPGGPYSGRPAYDTVIQAMGGLFDQSILPGAQITGPNYADSIAALYAVQGVMGALFRRERTGGGCRVDIPMIDTMISFMTNTASFYFSAGVKPDPQLRARHSQCYVLECADQRRMSIHLSTPEKFWLGLLRAIERPELNADPRFGSLRARIENFDELSLILADSFRRRSLADWEPILEAHDVPYAPVNDFEDIEKDPQIAYLRTLHDIRHPTMGPTKSIGRPIFYDGERDFDACAAPLLGEHTESVLADLGLSSADIERLRQAAVI